MSGKDFEGEHDDVQFERESKLKRYDAQLRRQEMQWRAEFEKVLASDKAAVDIGLIALRSLILVNGGAIAALFAFAGPRWADSVTRGQRDQLAATLLNATRPYVSGLVLAICCSTAAYLYQSVHTYLAEQYLESLGPEGKKPGIGWISARGTFALVMIGLAFASLGFFVYGTWGVIDAVKP